MQPVAEMESDAQVRLIKDFILDFKKAAIAQKKLGDVKAAHACLRQVHALQNALEEVELGADNPLGMAALAVQLSTLSQTNIAVPLPDRSKPHASQPVAKVLTPEEERLLLFDALIKACGPIQPHGNR